ncbi:hypothetical protein HDV05_007959 [Chytridiales sp. JEL 0842]|nr:hypothetical protein HDV05_007959 [Chytridiales sp. JEL 0842]
MFAQFERNNNKNNNNNIASPPTSPDASCLFFSDFLSTIPSEFTTQLQLHTTQFTHQPHYVPSTPISAYCPTPTIEHSNNNNNNNNNLNSPSYFFASSTPLPQSPPLMVCSSPVSVSSSRRNSTASQKPYDPPSTTTQTRRASGQKRGEGMNLRMYLKPFLSMENFEGCQYNVESFPEALDALLGVLLECQPESFYSTGLELNGFRTKLMFTEEALQRAKDRMDADSEVLMVETTQSIASSFSPSSPAAPATKLGGERWRVWMPPALNKKFKACKTLFAPPSTTLPMFVELLLELVGRRNPTSTPTPTTPSSGGMLSAVYTQGLSKVALNLSEEKTREILVNDTIPTPLSVFTSNMIPSKSLASPVPPTPATASISVGGLWEFDFQGILGDFAAEGEEATPESILNLDGLCFF